MARLVDEKKIKRIREATIELVVQNGYGGSAKSSIASRGEVAEGRHLGLGRPVGAAGTGAAGHAQRHGGEGDREGTTTGGGGHPSIMSPAW